MKGSDLSLIKSLLDEAFEKYNSREFIGTDPVLVPHQFIRKEDIEIAAFFSASLAWGNRKSIITNAGKLMEWMDNSPFDFISNHKSQELKPFKKFVHRTFNGDDCVFFIRSLKALYEGGGLESAFELPISSGQKEFKMRIHGFRSKFLTAAHQKRSEKHISDPLKNSSSKRLCMFLRWMVRSDKRGVDFGIWKSIKPSELHLPLDVHTGNVSRQLGLLLRKQNDWTAVEELTGLLRRLDPYDPVKYDFALFGLGVNKVMV